MEIEQINMKLDSFTSIVLKDASQKAGILTNQAKAEKQREMEEKENAFLKEAYSKIQEALRAIEKESNETYSSRLFESKQLLFQKRNDIINMIVQKVTDRLDAYCRTPEYQAKLRELMESGLRQVGKGEIHVFVDKRDMAFAETLRKKDRDTFMIEESDAPLSGGCIVVNRTRGLQVDFSFKSRLEQEKEAFLEVSGMKL